MNTLYIVVPCYNEEEVLAETSSRLLRKLVSLTEKGLVSEQSRIMFVDDGSRDRTWQIITELNGQNPIFGGVKLSRNRGHQNALLAGLASSVEHCDMMISMDADLQDDIDAVDGFIKCYHEGKDIVYGVRSKRDTDTAFKRGTAQMFYKLMKGLGVDIVDDHADYRLMSKRAVLKLMEYDEVNLFLRGIVPLIGFPTAQVYYERGERFAGESKYPLGKMLKFALDGICAFSVKPLRFVLWLGVVLSLFGGGMGLTLLLLWLFSVYESVVMAVLAIVMLFSGVQLTALGVVGEYVGRTYAESKRRPRFFVDKLI